MKVLLVGVLDVEWSTNCSMKRALEKLGHTVIDFNYRTVSSEFSPGKTFFGELSDKWIDKAASYLRSTRSPLTSSYYFRRNGRRRMNQLLLDTVKWDAFDLVLLSKTDTVDYRTVDDLNRYSRTWYYFMDPMDQAVRINAAEYAARATWASATFSDVHKHFKRKGAVSYWISQGVDTDVFYPEAKTKKFDVVFAGSKTESRSYYIHALRSAGFTVTCFGAGWENPPVYQEELVDIYRKSRIVLNLCREGSGFSIRVFQVMGTGAFMLSEYCPDLETYFKQGEHLDWFKDKNEMTAGILYYLENKEERSRIALSGQRLVYEKYSWDKIMQQILTIVHVNSKN